MNTIEFLISPIAGSVIGYFTNWLAIKMLFKPYTEKRILGIKIPFTPGLIPKEKDRLAKKVGETIGAHLLSEEVLLKALTNEKVMESLDDAITNIFLKLREEDRTIDNILDKILVESKENKLSLLEDKFTDFIINKINNEEVLEEISLFIVSQLKVVLDKNIEDISIDNIFTSEFIKDNLLKNYISEIKKENNNLSQIIPSQVIKDIKDIIKSQFINYMPLIINYLEKPFIQEKIKKAILDIIEDNVGKLALVFVDENKIYTKLIKYIRNYVQDENKRQEIINYIYDFMDTILEKPAGEWVENIENNINNIIKSENIEKLITNLNQYVVNNKDFNLLNIIQKIKPNAFYDIEKWIVNYIIKSIKNKEIYNIIKGFISKEINTMIHLPISKLMKEINASFEENLKEEILKNYKYFIIKQSSNVVKILDIPYIVEERIKEFEIDYTEKIILSVVDRELKAITFLGAILGFIIGLIPVII